MFKVGDRIRCINASEFYMQENDIKLKQVVTVTALHCNGKSILVNNYKWWVYMTNFEKIHRPTSHLPDFL